jgi:hypothetical protein
MRRRKAPRPGHLSTPLFEHPIKFGDSKGRKGAGKLAVARAAKAQLAGYRQFPSFASGIAKGRSADARFPQLRRVSSSQAFG